MKPHVIFQTLLPFSPPLHQRSETALMLASVTGRMECVNVLLDKGAEVNMQNKVSGVVMHCVHAMQHVPRVPSSEGIHRNKNPV